MTQMKCENERLPTETLAPLENVFWASAALTKPKKTPGVAPPLSSLEPNVRRISENVLAPWKQICSRLKNLPHHRVTNHTRAGPVRACEIAFPSRPLFPGQQGGGRTDDATTALSPLSTRATKTTASLPLARRTTTTSLSMSRTTKSWPHTRPRKGSCGGPTVRTLLFLFPTSPSMSKTTKSLPDTRPRKRSCGGPTVSTLLFLLLVSKEG